MDIAYLALIVLLYLLISGLIIGCDRLGGRR